MGIVIVVVVIPSGVEGPAISDLGRTQPRLPQQFLGEAHRAADADGDLAHAVTLAALHPEHRPLRHCQRRQDFVRADAGDILRRLYRALRRFLVHDAPFLPPVVDTRIANGRVEPRLGMLNGFHARVQPGNEDVMHERLRLVRGNAVFFLGMRAQPDG